MSLKFRVPVCPLSPHMYSFSQYEHPISKWYISYTEPKLSCMLSPPNSSFIFSVVYSTSLDKCRMVYIHHYNIVQNLFCMIFCPKFTVLCLFIPLFSKTQVTDAYLIFQFFIFQNIYELDFYSMWLFQIGCFLSGNVHLIFFHVYSWLDSLFLNNIPLSGWTILYLSVHLPKDILIA
jgi:hypothetical protein